MKCCRQPGPEPEPVCTRAEAVHILLCSVNMAIIFAYLYTILVNTADAHCPRPQFRARTCAGHPLHATSESVKTWLTVTVGHAHTALVWRVEAGPFVRV